MPWGGDFVSFFRPGGRSFALKSCPRGGDFDGKISGPGVSPGGMVTCQIDTCIREYSTNYMSNSNKNCTPKKIQINYLN